MGRVDVLTVSPGAGHDQSEKRSAPEWKTWPKNGQKRAFSPENLWPIDRNVNVTMVPAQPDLQLDDRVALRVVIGTTGSIATLAISLPANARNGIQLPAGKRGKWG